MFSVHIALTAFEHQKQGSLSDIILKKIYSSMWLEIWHVVKKRFLALECNNYVKSFFDLNSEYAIYMPKKSRQLLFFFSFIRGRIS